MTFRRRIAVAACFLVLAGSLVGPAASAAAAPTSVPAAVAPRTSAAVPSAAAVRTAAVSQVVAVPRPDHTVVLVMENHSSGSILGNLQAPYLNELAASGASMTQSFGVTHPSQPNYLALFSGTVSGVTDDSCPQVLSDANLATQLTAAGLTFATYSEDLPSVGYTGCTSGKYARKHNPAVNFPAVAATANQPLTAFPTDYSTLPTVSYVVPNLVNDMHDGTIAQGDAWVQAHLKGYLTWAQTHNSLLVVTWDEDDYTAANQIPTLFVGAGIAPGNYAEHITHYDVLRTLQDAYGLPPLGASAAAHPLLDIWLPPAGAPTAAFTFSCSALTCATDASASTGGAGALTSYSWNWGDGSAVGTGLTAGHTYAASGDVQVSLTVRNDAGQAATVSQLLSPRAAGDTGVLATDSFARTVSGGFGSADVGGAWTVSGAAAKYSVGAGTGVVGMPTAGTTSAVALAGVSSTDSDLRVSVATDRLATGNGTYVGLVGRSVSATANYNATVRIRGDGAVVLSLASLQGSSAALALRSALTLSGVTVAAGDVLRTRLQVTGTNPTTVRLKVWPRAAAEPAAWQLSATDSYAGLQRAGSIALNGYLSSGSTNAPVALRLSELSVRSSAAVPVNVPPTARLTVQCSALTCTATGAASTDADGTVAGYSWNWGDGSAAGSGATANHNYAAPGHFPVTLTVTDNAGATASAGSTATPTAPVNQPPVAVPAVTCLNLVCAADGAASTDPEGAPLSYVWNWGDGSTGSGSSTSHPYQAAGTYLVTLTVSDPEGATNSGAVSVSPTLAPNVLPRPSIGVSCVALVCTADSSGSVDPDGTITDYGWNWGDGSVTTGATSSHTYAAGGSYAVTLTTTDNRGGTAALSQAVTVAAVPANGPFAADTFARTVAGGWGSAVVGGPWTLSGGAANFSVSSGAGSMVVPKAGATVGAVLAGATAAGPSSDLTLAVSTDMLANNSGTYFTFAGRRVSAVLEYDSRVRVTGTGAVVLSLGALTGSTTAVALSAQAVVPGLTVAAGGWLNTRLQVTGSNPTTIRARVWLATAAEPTGWQVTATDTTPALQVPGAIGLNAYVSSSATNAPVMVRVRDVSARAVTP